MSRDESPLHRFHVRAWLTMAYKEVRIFGVLALQAFTSLSKRRGSVSVFVFQKVLLCSSKHKKGFKS